MNKIFALVSILACAPSHCMERPGAQTSEVGDLFHLLLNVNRAAPAPLTGRHLLSLLESQMNGNFQAEEKLGEIKLQFPDYDPKIGKLYSCRLASANRSIDAAIAPHYALLKNTLEDVSSTHESLPIDQLVEKFKKDPFAEVEEAELQNTQIYRFMRFFMNGDMQAHLQNYKNELRKGKKSCEGVNETQERGLAYKKMQNEVNSIIFNRLALRSALASGDVAAINARTKHRLTITSIPPFLEFIKGLRRKAHVAVANCGHC